MSSLLELYLDEFLVFLMVLTRVSGLVMTAPILGARHAPMQIRGYLAISLALLVTPLQQTEYVEHPENLLILLVMIGSELALGMALGLGVLILFTGLQLTGQIAGQMSGMALADVFNPGLNSSVPVFGHLLELIALAVFVIIGGHRQVLVALLDTFYWTPPGSGGFSPDVVETLSNIISQSFVLGIRAAAPMMVALLLSVLIMGLISRTLPQLNIIAVGFSLNSMIMMAALSVSLGAAVWIFQDEVDSTISALRDAIVLHSQANE